ncbi:MAG: hypothetical protein WCC97_10775 [Candidatus Acidiferrales bacterium]
MPIYIDTIVCEDIRPELGGKVTLAGVFGEEVLLPVLPMALPSLSIMQRWRLPHDEFDRGVGQFSFGMLSPDGQLQRFPPGAMTAPTKGVYVSTLSFILKFVGFPVRLKGAYKFKTYVNGVDVNTYTFYILTPADMAAAQQEKAIGFKAATQSTLNK